MEQTKKNNNQKPAGRVTCNNVQKLFVIKPTPRAKFSFIRHPLKDQLIVYGGESFNGERIVYYSDLLFYDIAINQWHEIRPKRRPIERSGHQMVATNHNGGQLWLFGGGNSNVPMRACQNFWTMNLTDFEWHKINDLCGNSPSARIGHRMLALDDKLIIFGGFIEKDSRLEYYNDLHIYSLKTKNWQKIEMRSSVVPQPCSDFCMAAISNDSVLLWGGHSKRTRNNIGKLQNDMYILRFQEESLHHILCEWKKMKTTVCECIRHMGLSYAVQNYNTVYCFGGVSHIVLSRSKTVKIFNNSLVSFNPYTMQSDKVRIKRKTVPDVGISFTQPKRQKTDENKSNNKGNVIQSLPLDPTPSKPPKARMYAGMCICNNILYVYGGMSEDRHGAHTLNDFYSLDLSNCYRWTNMQLELNESGDTHIFIK